MAATHWPLVLRSCDSVPSVEPYGRAAAAATSGCQPVTKPFFTSGIGAQGGFRVPLSGCPARLPADSVSHPSMGHVLVWTAVTFRAAEEPVRNSLHRFGVWTESMSPGLTPAVPMTTSGWVEVAGGSGVGATPPATPGLPASTVSIRRAA